MSWIHGLLGATFVVATHSFCACVDSQTYIVPGMPFYNETERSGYTHSVLSSDSLTEFKCEALEPSLCAFSFQ